MDEHHNWLDQSVKALSKVGYGLSGGLVLGDVMQYLDSHAGAIGVILGFMTYSTQLVFSVLRHKAYIKTLERRGD